MKPVQVEALKNYPNLSNVTQFSVISIMNDALPKKSKESKLSFSAKKLDKYFPPQYSTKERENIIIQLLEQWSADQIQSEYEDEYYYEARKKENAKLDAELAGTFATVIGGLIGAVLSCLLFLLRRFDVLSSGLASLLFYMLTYTREWHVAVYITVAFVIFIASMILQNAFLAGGIIFTIFVSIAVAIIGAGWKAYDTEIQRNTVMVICFTVTVILGLISWKGIKAQESE